MNAKFSDTSIGMKRVSMTGLRGLVAVSALVLAACGGGGGGDGPTPTPPPTGTINPGDVNAVMDAIVVKIGNSEGLLEANKAIPAQTAADPKVDFVQAQTPASNGSTSQVPLIITASAAIEALFLKIPNANGLITVNVGAAGKALVEQKAAFATNGNPKAENTYNVEVTLPPNIGEGAFDFDVAVRDVGGNVSNTGRGRLVIARVGTGKLQFSLSWDSDVDLDLHVTEPDGNVISYFNEGPSSSGGTLDIDDLNGPLPSGRPAGEPEGVENIFWEDTAPNGNYIVRVDYYSGSLATNFVATVSIDGQIKETISVPNFQPTQGTCFRIYTLAFGGSFSGSTGTISNPVLTPATGGGCGD